MSPTFRALRSVRAIALGLGLGLSLLIFGPAAAQEVSPSSSPAADGLRPETSWIVRSFDALGDGLIEPGSEADVTVELLPDDRLEGESGCGEYLGAYRLETDSIGMEVAAKGRGSCSPAITKESTDFILALEAAQTWRTTDDGLELLDADGRVRVVMAAAEEPRIEGAWQVTAFARPNGTLQEAPDDGSMNLTLGPDGLVQGGTGCRLLDGEYMSDSDQALIVPLDTTGPGCEGRVRRAERWFLAALELVVLWQREGDELLLTDANGNALVELRAAADPPVTAPPSAAPST